MFNPNGESSVSVDLEDDRPPASLIESLFRAFPAREQM